MEFRLRPATAGDYEEVDGVANEAFHDMVEVLPHLFRRVPHSIPRQEYEARLADRSVFTMLAVAGGQEQEEVLGFLTAEMRQAPDAEACVPRCYGYVSYFGVKEAFQNKGAGTALFRHCMNEVAERGGTWLELKVWEFNARAFRFYERFGMRSVNRTMELALVPEPGSRGAGAKEQAE